MIAILTLIIMAVTLPVFLYRSHQRKYKGVEKLPGPYDVPVFSHIFYFSLKAHENFFIVQKFHKTYGKIVRLWRIHREPTVLVTDADVCEAILTSRRNITKSVTYDMLVPWLGTGLLTSTGSKWHRRRKIITPAFHFTILEKFVETFNACSDILVQNLSKEVGKPSTDIYNFVNLSALDTICETAMGTQLNAQKGEATNYIRSLKELLHLFFLREFSLWRRFRILYQRSEENKRCTKLTTELHEFTKSIIGKRRKEIENEADSTTEENERKKKTAFLDLLLKANEDGKPLSNEDIREEVDTFMFEGHDTVSSAASFTLFEISRHPEVQGKIMDELLTLFGNEIPTKFGYQDLKSMHYLEQVIKEGLRLYPSVAVYQRHLDEAIDVGDYHLPFGITAAINVYGMHREPDYFPDPEKFDPDRFTIENCKGRHPFCYLPFSAGPRNCIGQKFAMLEMKTVIAKVLLNYKLSETEPKHVLHIINNATVKSSNGICIKLEKRELKQ